MENKNQPTTYDHSLCTYDLIHRYELDDHLKQNYACNECNKKFPLKKWLKKHIFIEHLSQSLKIEGLLKGSEMCTETLGNASCQTHFVKCSQSIKKYKRQLNWVSKIIQKNYRDDIKPNETPEQEKKGWFDNFYNIDEDIKNFVVVTPQNKMKKKRLEKTDVSIDYHIDNINFDCTTCRLCKESFEYEFELLYHFIKDHKGKIPHQCPFCEHLSVMYGQLKEHWKTHGIGLNYYTCLNCSKTYKTKELLENVHKCQIGPTLTCEKCKDKFFTRNLLSAHLKKHQENVDVMRQSKNSEYTCRFCMENFSSARALRGHFIKHHPNEKPFVCSICNILLADKLNEHLKTHGIGEEFFCNLCNRRFNQKFKSKIHELWHQGIEYKCLRCKQQFLTDSAMKHHTTTQRCASRQSLQPLNCACGKVFSSRQKLQAHNTSKHCLDAAPLRRSCCAVCGKAFNCNSALVRHMRTHTGERPYACRVCGRGFSLQGNCRTHERTHLPGRKRKGDKELSALV